MAVNSINNSHGKSSGSTDELTELARTHQISRRIVRCEITADVLFVICEAAMPENRRREEVLEAESVSDVRGGNLAQLICRTVAKAKRRATLAILAVKEDSNAAQTPPAPPDLKDHLMRRDEENNRRGGEQPGSSATAAADTANVETLSTRRTTIERVKKLCKDLNAAGADPLWSPPRLDKYVNSKYQAVGGLDALKQDSLADLVDDLLGRLAAQKQNEAAAHRTAA